MKISLASRRIITIGELPGAAEKVGRAKVNATRNKPFFVRRCRCRRSISMTGNHDTETTRSGPSRRRVLEYGGVAVTGGIVGTTRAAAGTADDRPTRRRSLEGAMFAYQYAPGRARIVERDLEWRPAALESASRTHVVSYERSPSFRAFLFTDGALPAGDDGRGDDGAEPEPGPFALRDASGKPSESGFGSGHLTGVELALE